MSTNLYASKKLKYDLTDLRIQSKTANVFHCPI